MKAILVNYSYDPSWLKEYPELEVTIYDRSDDGIERDLTQLGKVYKTKNIGNVDYDKLGYLIENYDNLPEVFLWGKTNLFKYISEEEWKRVKDNTEYTPLLTQNHKTYGDKFGQVCYYQGGMYYERADSWFFNVGMPHKFNDWGEWADTFRLPKTQYIPFAPGGNYILTRAHIHRYSRDFYEHMRSTLEYAQLPVEAHCAERSYHLLWK